MDSIVTKRIQAAVREHRLASIVRGKGRSFATRATSDLKFLFVDYPECQPGSNSEIRVMLEEYEHLGGTETADGKALMAEAFNQDPGFFRFLKMLELYDESLGENTRFILSADNPILALMQDPSLLKQVSKRKLAKRPARAPAPAPAPSPAK